MYRPLGNRWRDEEEEDADERDIRLTLKSPSSSITEFIYYTIQPGDTLHNISVRFSCSVASIKRLNNLWSDQDFYGLTKLKLPVGKFRLITDLLDPTATVPITTTAAAASTIAAAQAGPLTTNQPPIVLEQQFYTTPDEQRIGGGDQIFKDVDTNIETARKAASSYKNHANEIMQSLALSGNLVADDDDDDDENGRQPDLKRMAQREAETLLNDLTDYGLSYNGLILFIFIVCLICPLAYVIYLEETHLTHETNNKLRPDSESR